MTGSDTSVQQDLSSEAMIVKLVERIARRVDDEKEYLTELDSKIGDADFGVNLDRGLTAVLEELDGMDVESTFAAEIVETVGRVLMSEMAGSSGILFGGGLMTASAEIKGGTDAESFVAFAWAYVDHVEEKGDVSIGAKTMFDAIVPAVNLLSKSVEHDERSPAETTGAALAAARRGAKFTSTLEAKKGRASYVESRSIGHPDPGAVFTAIVFEEIHSLVQEATDQDIAADVDDPL